MAGCPKTFCPVEVEHLFLYMLILFVTACDDGDDDDDDGGDLKAFPPYNGQL